jgi:hypothetical protein
MSNRASYSTLDQFRTAPLRGPALLGVTLVTWVTGALYCSGYERLLSGLDNWPGSLIWSASAVLPWLTLFEWSKSRSGRRLTASIQSLAVALVVTGVLSLVLGRFIDSADGHAVPLALSTLRRLPAAGVGLLLILWSRAGVGTSPSDCGDEPSLASIAEAIDWVEAADNYVELHIGGRVAMRRMTLRNAERVLRKRGFIRVHRRFLVNGRKIAAIHGANGDMVVRLVDGTELPVGRAFSPNLATAA